MNLAGTNVVNVRTNTVCAKLWIMQFTAVRWTGAEIVWNIRKGICSWHMYTCLKHTVSLCYKISIFLFIFSIIVTHLFQLFSKLLKKINENFHVTAVLIYTKCNWHHICSQVQNVQTVLASTYQELLAYNIKLLTS